MTYSEILAEANGRPFHRKSWGGNGYWKDIDNVIRRFWNDGEEITGEHNPSHAIAADDWILWE